MRVIRVNVGGPEYIDLTGRVWEADRRYIPGSWGCTDMQDTDVLTTKDAISGTEDFFLYRSVRVGEKLTYRFDLPNGIYAVKLLLAEIYWETGDAELQDVFIQGKKILNRYSMYHEAGHDAAVEKTFDAEVTEGFLDILFTGLSAPLDTGARVCAIEIEPTGSAGAAGAGREAGKADRKAVRAPSAPPTADAGKRPSSDRLNVILISFDTLRRDHLHTYGYPRELSPAFDALAAGGVLFEDAVVNCGWTLPQHATLLSGLHPIAHRIVGYGKGRPRLLKRFRTLAERFRENGYLTFGLGNHGYADGRRYGFRRGIECFLDPFPGKRQPQMQWMVEPIDYCAKLAAERPFFMYVNVYDTHEPFNPPEPFWSMWGGEYKNRYEGRCPT